MFREQVRWLDSLSFCYFISCLFYFVSDITGTRARSHSFFNISSGCRTTAKSYFRSGMQKLYTIKKHVFYNNIDLKNTCSFSITVNVITMQFCLAIKCEDDIVRILIEMHLNDLCKDDMLRELLK